MLLLLRKRCPAKHLTGEYWIFLTSTVRDLNGTAIILRDGLPGMWPCPLKLLSDYQEKTMKMYKGADERTKPGNTKTAQGVKIWTCGRKTASEREGKTRHHLKSETPRAKRHIFGKQTNQN